MSRPRLVCPQKTWLTLSLSVGALKRVKEMMPEEAADGAWEGLACEPQNQRTAGF